MIIFSKPRLTIKLTIEFDVISDFEFSTFSGADPQTLGPAGPWKPGIPRVCTINSRVFDLTCFVEISNAQYLNVFESVDFDLIEYQCDLFHFIAYGTLGHETQAQLGPPPGEGRDASFIQKSEYCARALPALRARFCFGLLVIAIPRPLR